MAEDERTRRWSKLAHYETASDTIQVLRVSIAEVRNAPRDPEARRRLRAIAAEHGLWDQLAVLLADEARAASKHPERAAAFYEELADVHENLDQPLETIAAMEKVAALDPDNVERLDRLAWLYRRAGGWAKAAETFERVGQLAQDDRSRAALRAAGTLYRENGRLERAVGVYKLIVARRASDTEAWRALDDLLTELGRWSELAQIRGVRASRAESGVEKAALLRSQARALEHAGEQGEAAALVAQAARHAPDNLSGLVDYAEVLARSGQGREAAEILRQRVNDAIDKGSSGDDVAALRLRYAGILEEACQDRDAANGVLEELLAASPEYLPALERITAAAATDPDPRVHAAALLRYAAALPDQADRSLYISAAASRYREAGDHKAAVRAFERASEMLPDDDQLRRDLDEERTALSVERATAEAADGDVTGAERRLRALLATQPHDLGAHLALARILASGKKLDAAAEHLREALANAPDTTAGEKLAPLVFEFSKVMARLGDTDESHQLLHEAHRLDRRSLPITLALGESCFARKLWRQASLHLGALADHPDTARHAPEVALGLVHAAQAEARSLRPANALAHYERAIKIDPECGPAWHALAEVAIEKADLLRAAECLEREAMATKNPRDRLRLFDALGDMALDVLGDPPRAERCWMQVSNAGSPTVLEKLLGLQRRRGAPERAETCLALAAALSEPQRIKELTEEAAEAFVAGKKLDRATELAAELMQKYPRDLDAVACATAVAAAASDSAKIAGWLRPTLAAWEASGERDPDPRRADLWRRLGDAERDLGNEHAALESFRKAVLAAPESDGALAARRGLVELAATTGRPQHSALFALVEATQDPFDVLAWARNLARSGEGDDARAAYELALGLDAKLTAEDEKFYMAHPPRQMASDEGYTAPISAADRKELIDDEDESPIGELLDILGEAYSIVAPSANAALVDANLMDAKRLPSTSDHVAAAMYPQLVKLLGGPQTLLYTTSARKSPDTQVLLSQPPVVVIGGAFTNVRAASRSEIEVEGDAAVRFSLARVVELSRPRRIFAAADPEAFKRLIAGLRHAFGPPSEERIAREIAGEGERLRSKLTVALRGKMTERLATNPRLDAGSYIAACYRAGDRAGLIACCNAKFALRLATDEGRQAVAKLAASPKYLALRRKLRGRAADAEVSTNPFNRSV
jgi:tetratricopeptide (TPR) repeat protein